MVGAENLSVGQHVVQFYGHDGELAERVSDYLWGALDGGGIAVVIATREHRDEFEARLAKAGADLATARDDGAYVTLDAGEILREILAGGAVVDGRAFDRVIGSLIRRAAATGRPVRAYGELVALLWDDGLVNEAVQLEALWNELGDEYPFSLFCGYRAESATRDIDAFAEVCRLHQAVIGFGAASGAGVPGAVRIFAFSREAPATARHFAVAALREWGLADVADAAALVVTELAANAIVHAGSAFTVILSGRGDVLRIAVRDGCPLPAEGQAALMPLPLHGLGAVDALAARWGVESLGKAGKTVWVDLRR
ncbi:MAG TPA: MEDS domain-containing protein [Streptosporangiaceae bacterium]|nr:MEDS domain-containing protein [Streptosporangiaceae bacterium]